MADCNDISAWIVAAPEDPEETEMADEELTPVRSVPVGSPEDLAPCLLLFYSVRSRYAGVIGYT